MEYVEYTQKNQIGYITLNNPEHSNPLNLEGLRALVAAFEKSKANEDRVVIYSAKGDNFTFGADLKYGLDLITNPAMKAHGFEDAWSWQHLTSVMLEHPGIIIVGIQGWIVGGGFEHTLWSDFRVATSSARFMLPELDMGLFFSNASTKLIPQLIGVARAKQLMILSETLSGKQALDWGLINYLVPTKEELMPFMENLAQKLLKKAPASLTLAKQLINQSFTHTVEDQMYREGRAMISTALSEECKKRLKLFLEKDK